MATQPQRTASSVPELAPERQVRWPKRTKSQLANGLEIILLESHTIPKFHGELYFRSGNASAAVAWHSARRNGRNHGAHRNFATLQPRN